MKYFAKLCCVLIFFLNGSFSWSATLIGPYVGQGGKNNYVPVGILVSNTTLNAGILITDYNDATPLSTNGMQGLHAYKWDQNNQTWLSSVWVTFVNGWYPNFSIKAGDVLYIQYNNGPNTNCIIYDETHQSHFKIWQVGDPYIGTVQVTIKPGSNLLCPGITAMADDPDVGLGGDFPEADDHIWVLSNDWSPCEAEYFPRNIDTFSWIPDDTTGEYTWRWEGDLNLPYGFPGLNIGRPFWYYSQSSTSKVWSSEYNGWPE